MRRIILVYDGVHYAYGSPEKAEQQSANLRLVAAGIRRKAERLDTAARLLDEQREKYVAYWAAHRARRRAERSGNG